MALNLATIKSKTEESRGTVPKEEIESEIFKDPSPATGNSSLITISKIAAEKFMLAIEECVGDIEEQKALVDRLVQSKNEELQGFQSETIETFNALI